MKQQLLIEEINTEFSYLDITVNHINELVNIISVSEPNVFQKAAMNQFVSEFYNGIENILKRICKYNKINLPYGEDSHIKLFNMFIDNSNRNLPLLFSSDTVNEFKQIRKFRHFIIHGYSFKIEWSYIKESVPKIDIIYQIFKDKVFNYLSSIE